MSPRIILFRVDASLEIGTGHVMRCLTLADALRERGCECQFICREHPGNLTDLISERGFTVHGLPGPDVAQNLEHELDSPAHAAWLGADLGTDAAQVSTAIGEIDVEWLVVDHYAIDERWERELRSFCRKLMVIDDLADRKHDCDLLLDQNLVEGWQNRYRGKVPDNCALLLGPEYALLQPGYADLHNRVPPREGPIRRIFVYFGGADTDNLTGMVISAFGSLNNEDVSMDVVINPASPHIASIRKLADKDKRIRLHELLTSLAPLIAEADLAIGAGGVTTWERCCLGLPTLIITLAENQRPIVEKLGRAGLVQWLGHKDRIDAIQLARSLQTILETGTPPEWSQRCRALIDGKGAERVVSFLLLDAQTKLLTRLARLDDENILLQWANDPVVRKYAFQPDAIDPDTHHKWFHKRLGDHKNCRLYIVETENKIPIGQVRFDKLDTGWEISYSLDSRVRGRGMGKSLLQNAILTFKKTMVETQIFARVKDDNIRSHKLLERINFHLEAQKRGMRIYSRKL